MPHALANIQLLGGVEAIKVGKVGMKVIYFHPLY